MTQEQIIEGNKLIAEFMGDYRAKYKVSNDYTLANAMLKTLKYHSSWEWLMDAVDKIESIIFYPKDIPNFSTSFSFIIHKKFVMINGITAGYPANKTDVLDSKRMAVWLSVVEFIKWYNANK